MNFRLTMVLTALMVIVAGMLAWLQPWAKSDKPAEDVTKNLVFSPAPEGVKTLTYVHDGEKQVTFSKDAGRWMMTYPVSARADTFQVEDIIRAVTEMRFREKFEPEASGTKSAAATGTDKPKNSVTFEDEKGRKYAVNLGKRTIDAIYATLEGAKTVYMVENNPLDRLDKDPQEFRDKSVEAVRDDQVTGLAVKHPGQTVTLTKSDGKWLISSPVTARASAEKVAEMLNEFRTIRATGFSELVTKESPATGLNPPVVSVSATIAEAAPPPPATGPATGPATQAKTEKTVTLELGYYVEPITKKNVYASIAGTKDVFTFDAKAFEKLNKELKDLRDPAITPAPLSQATEFTVTTEGKVTAAATKKDDKWTLTSVQPPVTGDNTAIDAVLSALRDARAIKYVDNAGDLKSIGLDPPHTKVELTVPGQAQHEVILIGNPQSAEKVTPVMRQGEQTVYLVQSADLDRLNSANGYGLRDKVVEGLTGERIRTIAVTGTAANGGGFRVERDGMKWSVKQGNDAGVADDVKLSGLLGDLTPLVAVKYLEAMPTGTPQLTVEVGVTEAAPAATGPAATTPAITVGPDQVKTGSRTLRLFQVADKWQGTWEGNPQGAPAWAFEPTAALIEHLTKVGYLAPPTTAPATGPATAPK